MNLNRVEAPQSYTCTTCGFHVSIDLQRHDDNEWYWAVSALDSDGDAMAEPVATGICMAWHMAVACAEAAVAYAASTTLQYLTTPQTCRPADGAVPQ